MHLGKLVTTSLLLLFFYNATLQANVNDDDDSAGETISGDSSVNVITELPRSTTKISTPEQFKQWLSQEKSSLGFSQDSTLESLEQDSPDSQYQVFSVHQKVNGLPIYGHQSTLILKNGQPQTGFITASKHLAPVHLKEKEIENLILKVKNKKEILIDESAPVEKIYWHTDTALIAAIIVPGLRIEGEESISTDFIFSGKGEILSEIENRQSVKFRIADFDTICNTIGARNRLINPQLVDQLIGKMYTTSSFWSNSRAGLKSSNERGLFDFMTDANRFMNEILGSSQFSRKRNFTVSAYVSTGWYQVGPNCARKGSNAYWDSRNRILGLHSPYLNNPDVILHELGHGIISESSNLIYKNQSGALNESIADMLGVSFASWKKGRFLNPTRDLWNMYQGSRVIRDFVDPTSVVNGGIGPSPDHYSIRYRGRKDKGGVHINSSITNHAFYLLSMGGTHRLGGDYVTPIGRDKALKIWHYAGTKLMTPFTNFRDARRAVAKAAEIIYGEYSQERTSVHQSFDAVGIPGAWARKVKPKQEPKKDEQPKKEERPKKEEPKKETPKKEIPKQEAPIKTPPKTEQPEKAKTNNLFIYIALSVLVVFAIILIKKLSPKKSSTGRYRVTEQSSSASSYSTNDAFLKSGQTANQLTDSTYQFQLETEAGDFPLYSQQLNQQGVVIGRNPKAEIVLTHGSISSFHARVTDNQGQLYIEDIGSTYGTFLNKNKINSGQLVPLKAGDLLAFSDYQCRIKSTRIDKGWNPQASDKPTIFFTAGAESFPVSASQLHKGITIGRAASADIQLSHSSVSSHHMRLSGTIGAMTIEDLGSTYGTYVNKQKITPNQKVPINIGVKVHLSDLKCSIIADNKPNNRAQLWLMGENLNFELDDYGDGIATFTIGRASENSLVVPSQSVSSKHGVLKFANGQWCYQDIGSSYGSFIKHGGKKRTIASGETVTLNHNDILYLADFRLSVTKGVS